ncbi:hypothetical protein V7S43_003242 [Phytophthora oleae]|uniref:RxLR effector protein n=1 Tax=Phytophthora oleae TaxID=2107226 RepID=A0ABD3FYB6_9STRA
MKTTVFTSVLLVLLATIVQFTSAESITSTNNTPDTAISPIRRLKGSHKMTKAEAEERGVVLTAPALAAGLKSSVVKVNPAKRTALSGLSLKDRSKTTKIISALVAWALDLPPLSL